MKITRKTAAGKLETKEIKVTVPLKDCDASTPPANGSKGDCAAVLGSNKTC